MKVLQGMWGVQPFYTAKISFFQKLIYLVYKSFLLIRKNRLISVIQDCQNNLEVSEIRNILFL
ncbi:hypothetical protein A3B40_04935 [Candidatus Roizmanbacteria bacterium RIFCSPLOWO2_01_FULL_37_16]|uniref:Uncharacterized protein n=1 Tax=Candidatus Roizmanbacteria bacterium RIFCSPLOWO2_01_FULL_37_16 TaxID=1802058 RepID=A0A1F7IMU3_9BACT|nr:MAG: hypothetical protein A3B40_04935 [Candidatus Roizmanbacteria bacterium RIFCSPLOWO2_01_FULL_37_16]